MTFPLWVLWRHGKLATIQAVNENGTIKLNCPLTRALLGSLDLPFTQQIHLRGEGIVTLRKEHAMQDRLGSMIPSGFHLGGKNLYSQTL